MYIDNELYLVEIKNRKNRIFNFIPLYEKIQILLYSKACNINKCIFIQKYNEQIKETLITEFDELLYSEIIDRLNHITNFINILYTDEIIRSTIIDNKNINLVKNYISWI
jgi:hypothetical protein